MEIIIKEIEKMFFLLIILTLVIWSVLEPYIIKFYISLNPYLFIDMFLSEKDILKLKEALLNEK